MPDINKLILKRCISEADAENLNMKFLDNHSFDHLVCDNADAFDTSGNLLFRYRKNIIPLDLLKIGYESFKNSIIRTDGRGAAAGKWKFKQYQHNGRVSKIKHTNFVYSGTVGFMDRNPMNRYCRKTAFTKTFFEEFKAGLPFVQFIDKLYAHLCPAHYSRQKEISNATNRNYVIDGTSFTTITVNENFQTAVHKDTGDFSNGFGNLCVYREGNFDGCYFCLPEYRTAIDMQNGDMLFVDVHRFHGNTPFYNTEPNFKRISFVMYYRENMIECKQPIEELQHIKNLTGNFYRL